MKPMTYAVFYEGELAGLGHSAIEAVLMAFTRGYFKNLKIERI